jgi:hypothetical protein
LDHPERRQESALSSSSAARYGSIGSPLRQMACL